jgi:hypothetical protein
MSSSGHHFEILKTNCVEMAGPPPDACGTHSVCSRLQGERVSTKVVRLVAAWTVASRAVDAMETLTLMVMNL